MGSEPLPFLPSRVNLAMAWPCACSIACARPEMCCQDHMGAAATGYMQQWELPWSVEEASTGTKEHCINKTHRIRVRIIGSSAHRPYNDKNNVMRSNGAIRRNKRKRR